MSEQIFPSGKINKIVGIFTALLLVVGGVYYLCSSDSDRPPSLELGSSQFQGMSRINSGGREYLGFDKNDQKKFDENKENFTKSHAADDSSDLFSATEMTFNSKNLGLYYMYPEEDMNLAELIATIDPAAEALLVAHWNVELGKWAITPNTAYTREEEVTQLKVEEFSKYNIPAGNAVVVMAPKSTISYGLYNGDREPVVSFDICAQQTRGWYNFALNDKNLDYMSRCSDRIGGAWLETSIEPVTFKKEYKKNNLDELTRQNAKDLPYKLIWAKLTDVDPNYETPDPTAPAKSDKAAVIQEKSEEEDPTTAPELVYATVSDFEAQYNPETSFVELSWTHSKSEKSYTIDYKKIDNRSAVKAAWKDLAADFNFRVGKDSDNAIVTGLPAGTYQFRITATYEDETIGKPVESDTVEVKEVVEIAEPAEKIVENFTAKYDEANSYVQLNWTHSDVEEDYMVEFAVVPTNPTDYEWKEAPAVISRSKNSATIADLPIGTYQFRITAECDSTKSTCLTTEARGQVEVPEPAVIEFGANQMMTDKTLLDNSAQENITLDSKAVDYVNNTSVTLQWQATADMEYSVSYARVGEEGWITLEKSYSKIGNPSCVQEVISNDDQNLYSCTLTNFEINPTSSYYFKITAETAWGDTSSKTNEVGYIDEGAAIELEAPVYYADESQ